MRRLFAFFLPLLFCFTACVKYQNKVVANKRIDSTFNGKIHIPTAWIEKLRKFDYSRNDTVLLRKFESYIKPDTIIDTHVVHDSNLGRMLNPIFVDLDGDHGEELICLLGWSTEAPSLGVFKEIEGKWYLLYLENIYTFYNAPSLSVAGNFSKNKTFYLRHVDDHGSGIYADSYSFYKLINNKVYKCLNLLNEARIYGWGLYINQNIKMNFEFRGDGNDEIGVGYNYNFFPGAINQGDCSWCASEDVSLIKGEDYVWYNWNMKEKKYKLEIPKYKNNIEDLTASKIACFGAFGNDSLFVAAFGDQINETIKTGTKQQKRILKEYLSILKEEKTAITQKLEKKSQAGGTSFYGPANKK